MRNGRWIDILNARTLSADGLGVNVRLPQRVAGRDRPNLRGLGRRRSATPFAALPGSGYEQPAGQGQRHMPRGARCYLDAVDRAERPGCTC